MYLIQSSSPRQPGRTGARARALAVASALATAAGWGLLASALATSAPGPARAQDAAEPIFTAQASSSSRATVVELPPAAEDDGVVRLSTAATAEDVIQPVLEMERGKIVLLKPAYKIGRIAVGDPEVVDLLVNTSNEIQAVAKAVGNTNILIWDTGGRLQATIDIHVGAIRAQVIRELQRVLGRNDVTVDMAGDSVILRGSVPDLATSEAAEAVATAFFTEADDNQGDGGAREPRIVNLLSVGGNHQVMIEVTVAEMSRSVRRAFGANLDALFLNGQDQVRIRTLVRNLTSFTDMMSMGNVVRMDTLTNDIKLVGSLVNTNDLVLSVFLELLESESLGKVLAEPLLTARSGQLASFLAGGEIPIPVPQDDNTITIIFKRFGVQLEFIPTVLSEDRIHLEVSPEFSQPDFTLAAAAGFSTTIPSFRTRRVSTAVELADGQSFAIGGLAQELVTTSIESYPILGEIPILGALFKSQRFQRDETELVVIVTPRLVKPLGPDPLPLPTDSYVAPDGVEFFVLGRIEGRRAPAKDVSGASSRAPRRRPEPSLPAELEPTPTDAVGGLIGDFGHRLRVPDPLAAGAEL